MVAVLKSAAVQNGNDRVVAAGYYIDVGASQLIIDGRVQLRSGEVS